MKKMMIGGMATLLICVLLLFLTALIPQKSIQKNMEKSAEYYNDRQFFDHVTNQTFLSRQDNYADCILTNIIYHIDRQNIFLSVVRAGYYNPDKESVKESFSYSVKHETKPNVEYSRYWHGSMVILRPLFVFGDIRFVRFALGLFVLLLVIWLEYLLIKKGYMLLAICYILGHIVTSTWMSAFCMEYAMPFVVLGVELPILFLQMNKQIEKIKQNRENEKKLDFVFYQVLLCAGIVTAFVDFLTTETITFTMAYLLFFAIREKEKRIKSLKEEGKCFVKGGLAWLTGYAGMILLKWIIACIVLGKEAFLEALRQAAYRTNGGATLGNISDAQVVSKWEQISGALWRNVGCLLPFKDTMKKRDVLLFVFLILLVSFVVWYLFRQKKEGQFRRMLLLVGSIPFLRFLCLNNHSYIHFFFTYRALLITVVVWLYCMTGFVLEYRKKGIR